MKHKIALVVDSGTDLPKEYVSEDVFVLPLKVIRNGVEYLDGVTIQSETVYQDLPTEDFKTSLPSLGEIEALYQKIKDAGYTQVLVVTISSGLSGTHNACRLAAEEFEGLEIELVDTLNIGIAAGLHAIYALDLIASGMDLVSIAAALRNKVSDGKIYFCLGTLEYLAKGGRIGKVASVLGHALNLKPIITCTETGVYDTVAKVRGRKQSIHKAIDLLVDVAKTGQRVNIAVANCLAEEEMMYIREELMKRLDNIDTILTGNICPAMAIHTGPGLLGLAVYKK
ncbi:MAG: DegV family protein [Erysipelotrichaceae bacterium]